MPDEFETDKLQREKALERPIDGRYPDLGKEVRRLLGWYPGGGRPFLTSRMADRKTGVNYSTIAAITRGDRASADSLRKLAEGLNGNPVLLLQLAGYVSPPHSPVVSEDRAAYDAKPITRELIRENIIFAGQTGIIEPEAANEMVEILERMRREKRGEE